MLGLRYYQGSSGILNKIDAGLGDELDLKQPLAYIGQERIPFTKKNVDLMRKSLFAASKPIHEPVLYRGTPDFWPVILAAYTAPHTKTCEGDRVPPWMRVEHQDTIHRLFDLGYPVRMTHWLSTSKSRKLAERFRGVRREEGYLHVIHAANEARGVAMPVANIDEQEVVIQPGGWLVPVKRSGHVLTWKWTKNASPAAAK